jgi:beta-glucanase (GH16 family)
MVSAEPGSHKAAAWELVWSDEFDYEGPPDPSKWDYEEGFIRNEEPQYYCRARRENARVENGMLVIEGRKEKFPNARHDPASEDYREKREFGKYTSASLISLGKADWVYGRIEVRAKVPAGSGVWPAIWTMGINRLPPLHAPETGRVNWPFCGEIDILEFIGKEPNIVHGYVHFPDPKTGKHKSKGKKFEVEDPPYNDFHVYAMERYPDRIDFFYDGQLRYSFPVDLAGEGDGNPFRKPHYLLLNLALGGWGGEIDESLLPQRYLVDYVRVYKEKGNSTEIR